MFVNSVLGAQKLPEALTRGSVAADRSEDGKSFRSRRWVSSTATCAPTLPGSPTTAGEAISTAFVESTVNQVTSKRMVRKQQMRLDTPRRAPLGRT